MSFAKLILYGRKLNPNQININIERKSKKNMINKKKSTGVYHCNSLKNINQADIALSKRVETITLELNCTVT